MRGSEILEEEKGKSASLRTIGSRGSEDPVLNLWTRKVASSDPPRS
jgi:hypothetical protein